MEKESVWKVDENNTNLISAQLTSQHTIYIKLDRTGLDIKVYLTNDKGVQLIYYTDHKSFNMLGC